MDSFRKVQVGRNVGRMDREVKCPGYFSADALTVAIQQVAAGEQRWVYWDTKTHRFPHICQNKEKQITTC